MVHHPRKTSRPNRPRIEALLKSAGDGKSTGIGSWRLKRGSAGEPTTDEGGHRR
jgi:hypothetical protein